MSIIHEYKCDKCEKRISAKYNGAHYLPPKEWIAIYSDERAELTGEHLCEKCNPLRKPKAKP